MRSWIESEMKKEKLTLPHQQKSPKPRGKSSKQQQRDRSKLAQQQPMKTIESTDLSVVMEDKERLPGNNQKSKARAKSHKLKSDDFDQIVAQERQLEQGPTPAELNLISELVSSSDNGLGKISALSTKDRHEAK